ncbi:MAG: lysostaphin resistance A-like protein [Planctomycetota bacterium]|jgi:membrane protease YdiL (CAAX protease family)
MILSTISDPNSVAASGAAAGPYWNEGSIGICTVGFSILVVWLFWCGGFGALQKAPLRRNRLSPFAPMFLLAGWILLMYGIGTLINFFFHDTPLAFQEAVSYPAMVVLELTMISVMLIVAYGAFARRLKGFGLNLRTVGKDMGFAFVNLAAVYGLVIMLLWVVLTVGQWLDPQFSLEEHQSLTFLDETSGLWLRIVTAVFAAIIVPIFEEMLFRGFLQTSIRSATGSPWLAIVLTSLLFVVLHPVASHMPALFALSCGLGYAYERSGSLLRPIFMHMMFNGLSVVGTLLGG